MATAISSTNPTIVIPAADAAAPGLLLQPGAVVNAQVVGLLDGDLVRIALAGLTLDVISEVALTPGEDLRLSVSQTGSGIRLAIVGGQSAPAAADRVTLSQGAAALAPASEAAADLPGPASQPGQLTPPERAALTAASEAVVTRQDSQAVLFANLAALVASSRLPSALRQAMQDVLGQQITLDQDLTGSGLEAAARQSGLFLEASLAAGSLPGNGPVRDLKAALMVLREVLSATLATEPPAAADLGTAMSPARSAAQSPSTASVGPGAGEPQPAGSGIVARNAPSWPASPADPLPPLLEEAATAPAQASPPAAAARPSRSIALVPGLSPVTETESPQGMTAAQGRIVAREAPLPAGTARRIPAPPFRGALPSAQPVAPASLSAEMPLKQAAQHLLDQTDAALARQTLLQATSLPERAEPTGQRLEASAPQWNFELPFATPQGTAMAQFAISRDGARTGDTEPTQPLWRARFSLDVEPAGPVHALVTLQRERTSVRIWAERPSTVASLRAAAGQLATALRGAELNPGDIVIGEGMPPQPAAAPAGHFLDRAL